MAAAIVVVVAVVFLRRNKARLEDRAEQAMRDDGETGQPGAQGSG